MVLRGIISDLDGVIVNTVPLHFKSWQRTFAELGIAFTLEDYRQRIDGIPRMDGIRKILVGWGEDDIEKAADRKQEIFLDSIKNGVETYPSTIALFEKAKAKGLALAAISSSKNCRPILRSVGIYDMFDTVITGIDITRGKPDPQIFLAAADNLNLEPRECVVFEDARLGVEAAKAASFCCVGVDRYGAPELLKEADLVVSDLAELDYDRLVRLCGGS